MSFTGFCIALLACIGFISPVYAMNASQQLAIIVNADDPQSKRIADYYQLMRGIPDGNIIRVNLPNNKKSIGRKVYYNFGNYEQVGNYVYTISEREIEKVGLGLDRKSVV